MSIVKINDTDTSYNIAYLQDAVFVPVHFLKKYIYIDTSDMSLKRIQSVICLAPKARPPVGGSLRSKYARLHPLLLASLAFPNRLLCSPPSTE